MKLFIWILAFLAAAPLALARAELSEQLATAGDNRREIEGFVETAENEHGVFGEKAAVFLVKWMPDADLKSLKKDFLMENLGLAMTAREQFPWAKELPEEVFLNDVLPYASLDETRESWREEFHAQCQELVVNSKTATEAAQKINREFFDLINVHYNTGRKAPNQSPSESKKLGMATCTGLSIILANACRSVGVPARVAGTALWSNKRGNHTWVEIYDGGEWFFAGADEYSAGGLNRAWFTGDAAKATAEDWKHAIWATSWKKGDGHFPMVWDLKNKQVGAVNVTARYTKGAKKKQKLVPVHVRIFDKVGGKRMVVQVDLLGADEGEKQSVKTKAGTADMNDMATLNVVAGEKFRLRLRHGEEVRTTETSADGEITLDLNWGGLEEEASLPEVQSWLALLPEERHLSVPERALSEEDARAVTGLVFAKLREEEKEARKEELGRRDVTQDGSIQYGVVKAGGKEMKLLEKTFGAAPEGGYSLWISMHGGGGAPARVNDQQWKNQIMLYAPEEGIVIAPRAPTNTWNLWHEGHIDGLFDRLIENYVLGRGVNPDRVYLMGYSAGGDGVYQLAPRMADRFAAASMMAGHPNGASPLGLRNLPFMIFMGGNDRAYSRNKVAAEWGEKLVALQNGDAGGYEHKVTIYEGLGHWMDGKDAEALPWMTDHMRDPWPKKVVWSQSNRTHDRFYWLSVPKVAMRGGQVVRAQVKGQTIEIEAEGIEQLTLRLSDVLLDLDQPVVVTVNGKEQFSGKVTRSVQAIWNSLNERADPKSVATATVELNF
tara:strand:+ start:7347 stop:9677 length:2331 start_codon:yes stop_codon:yes gene_type:complete